MRIFLLFVLLSADILTSSEPLTALSKTKSKKMRILLCVNYWIMYYGGASNYCCNRKRKTLSVGRYTIYIRSSASHTMSGHPHLVEIVQTEYCMVTHDSSSHPCWRLDSCVSPGERAHDVMERLEIVANPWYKERMTSCTGRQFL